MSLYEQHQAALEELEAAKRRCRNPVFEGGVTDVTTLAAFSDARAEVERCAQKCTALAEKLAAE